MSFLHGFILFFDLFFVYNISAKRMPNQNTVKVAAKMSVVHKTIRTPLLRSPYCLSHNVSSNATQLAVNLFLGGKKCIAHERAYCHRAYTSGNRGDISALFGDIFKVHIASETESALT